MAAMPGQLPKAWSYINPNQQDKIVYILVFKPEN